MPVVAGHRDKDAAVLGLAHLVDRAHVGVVQHRRRAGLVDQPVAGVRVPAKGARQELERGVAAQALVLGLEHDAHAALAQLVEQAVLPDAGART